MKQGLKKLGEDLVIGTVALSQLAGAASEKALTLLGLEFGQKLNATVASQVLSAEELADLKVCCGNKCGDGPYVDKDTKFPDVGVFVQHNAGNYSVDSNFKESHAVLTYQQIAENCVRTGDFDSTKDASPCESIAGIAVVDQGKEAGTYNVDFMCADGATPSMSVEKSD